MHIHILGICGTFMAGVAALAVGKGYRVTGSDQQVYPPMSNQLQALGIELIEGYDEAQLNLNPDLVIVGNAMKRGMPVIEALLNRQMTYTSGPQWLAEAILADRWVLAVAGTHGKTTTASMLAWILQYAQLQPGFLIGGIANNFKHSADLGRAPFFVIEADEYDSAFFDKRAKFVHYHPRTLVLNNLEFDHADIYPDLNAIETQFHHLIRTVPSKGLIITPADSPTLSSVLERGCWSKRASFGRAPASWALQDMSGDGSSFSPVYQGKVMGTIHWQMLGMHNVNNAMAAIIAANHAGVAPAIAVEALNQFQGVKRRMEVKGQVNGVTVYDDFAHHPTAIQSTLAGLRARVGAAPIIAILELGSYTMKSGFHGQAIVDALTDADMCLIKHPASMHMDGVHNIRGYDSTESIITDAIKAAKSGVHIVIMSNSGFDNIHNRLLDGLEQVLAT